MSRTIFVDIDDTICFYDRERDYRKASPDLNKIQKINLLFEQGNTIVYWTARGSTTGIDWSEVTRQQLKDWGAKYHTLRCDKPHYDVFIDDKSIDNVDKI